MNVKVAEKLAQDPAMMRDVLSAAFEDFVTSRPNVVYLDADLMNSSGMGKFAAKHPDKAVNCGIQEANMIGVAAGMAATGLIPFTHTFGAFAARRVADQVFLSVAYAGNNVKMLASDPGIRAATNGGTHMPFEDIAIMRAIPTMTIVEPTDTVMLKDLLPKIADADGPFYIRLTRKNVIKVYEEGSTFDLGRAALLRSGTDVTLIGSGLTVSDCLEAADLLAAEGIRARVLDMFTVKPIDRDAVVAAARATGAIVTAENHNVLGGLGSAVAEVLAEECPTPLRRIGSQDEFGEVGSTNWLKERFHMTAADIAQAAREVMQKK